MQRPSPSRDSITSPKRPATGKKVKSSLDLEIDNQSLRVDLEHHKNLLIGLNEKLIVFNDLKQDLDQHRTMLQNTESAR